MNKILYVTATLLFLMGSCISEAEPESPQTENIRFGVVVREQPETRGAIIETGTYNGAIKLWAGFKDSEPNSTISGAQVAVGTVGTTTSDLIWNSDGREQYFYALHPASGAPNLSVALDGNSASFTGYTIPDGSASQVDLIVAGCGPVYREVVELTFDHALTRVTFEAKKAVDFPTGTTIELTKIVISGACNQGDGAFTATQFAWTGKRTSGTPAFTIDLTGGPLTLVDTGFEEVNPDDVSDPQDYENMFLLPHTQSDLNAVTMTVHFKQNNVPLTRPVSLGGLNYGPHDGWVKGEWVNYQITIAFDGIEVSAQVISDWVDQNWSEQLDEAV